MKTSKLIIDLVNIINDKEDERYYDLTRQIELLNKTTTEISKRLSIIESTLIDINMTDAETKK